MLDLMRKHAKSWLIKVALGGIIIVFVFWYGWSGPGERTRTYAAKVNGTVITYDRFYNVYESELEKIRLRFKGSLPPDFIEKVNLKKNVITGLVHQILLLQEADRLGMFVTDEDLVRDIRSNPMFHSNGVFDENVYRMYLNSIKLTPTMFEQSRKQELLEEQLVRLLTDAVKTDPGEIKKWWHFQNDKLVLSLLLIKPEETSTGPVDIKTLESYFKKNQAKYEIPQSLNLQYVVFSWPDIMKRFSVSDEEVRTYFDMNPKEFLIPEKIRARHILLATPEGADAGKLEEVRARIADVLNKIKNGENFQKLAESLSEDATSKDKGGDLGLFSRGTLNPDFEEAAFKLEVGQVSEPVKTKLGYHIIRVDERQPEKAIEFQSAKDEIAQKLLEGKARRQLNEEAEKFYEQVYRTEDLEAQAKKFGFELRRQDFVSKAGSLPPLGSDAEVIEEAFRLKTGEISRMIKSGDSYVVMMLVDRNKERVPSLDEVRSEVERDYLKEQALLQAGKTAEQVIKDLQGGSGSEEDLKRQELSWEQLDPISRTAGFVPRLGNSPEVAEMLTTVSMESPLFPTPIPTADGVAVVKLVKVDVAGDEQYSKEAQAFEKWVLEVRKTEFLKGWIRLLEERSKIEISDKLL